MTKLSIILALIGAAVTLFLVMAFENVAENMRELRQGQDRIIVEIQSIK